MQCGPLGGSEPEQEMAINEKLGTVEQNMDFSWFPAVINDEMSILRDTGERAHWKGNSSPIFATFLKSKITPK